MPEGFYHRFGLPLILCLTLIGPIAGYASLQVLRNSSNDREQWLPESFKSRQDYRTFVKRFGSQEAIIASWEGCTVDDPRLDLFAEGVQAASAEGEPLVDYVLTGRNLLRQMTSEPREIPREAALLRLKGVVVGPDLETTCAVIRLTQAGAEHREQLLETVHNVASQQCRIPPDELHLGGTSVDIAATNRASDKLFYEYSGISALISIVIACVCLRNWRLVIALFETALLATGLGMLLFWFSGQPINILLMMLPALWFTLAISGSIHFINYYRDAATESPKLAAERAVRKGWLPCTLATATTSIGLGSLMVCDIVPVFMFGLFSALGLLAGLALILLLLPSILAKWVSPESLRLPPTETDDDKTTLHSRNWRFWSAATDGLQRVHAPVSLGFLAAVAIVGLGLLWIYPSAKLKDYFPTDSRIYRDYAWLETHVAPLMPLEVALEIDEKSKLSMLQRMELTNTIVASIEGIDLTGGGHPSCYSALTLVPEIPKGQGIRNIIRRRTLLSQLQKNRDQFTAARYVLDEPGKEVWRITVRVSATSALDYGKFADEVERRVAEVLQPKQTPDAREGVSYEHVSATVTGPVRLLSRVQTALLDVLYESFALAFALIGVAMMITLRSIPGGLVAMAPNLFPVLVCFGTMGWLGMSLDVGSIMTASVALGIAVDDTFHFLVWYSRGRRSGLSQRDAVFQSYRHCGVAMTQTSLICGCGLLVFLLSEFSPAARFGGLMFAMLMAALAGDLLFLPALLLGPAGRLFGSSLVEGK
ncbi:MAG: MMPL family transporter [Pirellulaceae bacterium]